MRNLFKVHDESIEEFPSKSAPGGIGRQRRVILMDAAKEGKLLGQFWELSLPGDHPEIGKGNEVLVEVSMVERIFSGRPQVRGTIVPSAKAPRG